MGGVTCLLLLLWAGVTVSSVLDLQKRIYGGHDCKTDERLFHVELKDKNGNFICGGSLISDRWILTAAHCWVRNLKVVVGVHPGPGTVQNIEKSVKYKDHDIMLLKLPVPSLITPVKLPDCKKTLELGDPVQIGGHEATTAGPNGEKICGYSPTLQCADSTVVKCLTNLPMHTLCGKRFGVDACPGDSGGGVLYDEMIYGVHVRSGKCFVCKIPHIFMDVCKYMDWIRETTMSTSTKFVDKMKACIGCG